MDAATFWSAVSGIGTCIAAVVAVLAYYSSHIKHRQNPAQASSPTLSKAQMRANTDAPVPEPTEQERIDDLPSELQRVYLEMRRRAMAFGPQVETYATRKNLVFKAGKMFAEIQRRKASLRVLIRPEGFNIPENTSVEVHGVTVTRVPDTHLWTVNHKFEVDSSSPMDGVEKPLRQSYEAVST